MLSTHTMQYGKGITTGLILEPAHRQGESERTEEGKGNIRAETNNITKSHIKVRACPPTPLCFCVCVCAFTFTQFIDPRRSGGKTWNGAHMHTHINTHLNEMLMIQGLSRSSFRALLLSVPLRNHQGTEGAANVRSSFKLCHYVATHPLQWRGVSHRWL